MEIQKEQKDKYDKQKEAYEALNEQIELLKVENSTLKKELELSQSQNSEEKILVK